ncbi:MAG TPA: HEAT repeat domain-containing protein [Geobacteraceae bacterium]|nr:HEAT repeat domain-containing protein [Geobacteraceae bacterium]
MENKNNPHNEPNPDTKNLSAFIIELNIALRLVTSYPKDHPVITASIQKVLKLLEKLHESGEEITIGVARDTLMAGHAPLDSKNPVYKNLARVLFDHDIAAITFNKNVTPEELKNFCRLMLRKREDIRESGGIETVASEAGVSNIRVKRINYSYFTTTEEDRIAPSGSEGNKKDEASLWENFVHGLLDGKLDPSGVGVDFAGAMEPGFLADMINGLDRSSAIRMENFLGTIDSFVGGLDRGTSNDEFYNESIEKFGSFVSRLNPELRKQFLNGTFSCIEPGRNLGKEILDSLGDDIVLEVLEDINSRVTYLPSLTAGLLRRLSENSPLNMPGKTSSTPLTEKTYEQFGEKLRIVFSEEARDEFVPDSYQKALEAITSSGRVSTPELEDIAELRETLLGHSVETHICRIILEIMREPAEDCLPEALERNFLELVDYLLEMGDFSFLARIYGQLADAGSAPNGISTQSGSGLQTKFRGREFVEKVLCGLDTWEKSKHCEIRELIRLIGSPFIDQLLERLAEEQNMSMRRFYIDCLMDQGNKILDPVILRLMDKRWYFLRNLVIILRELDDPSVLRHVRRLCNSPHPKVRQEVIRTFQHFRHPEADNFLILDMNSSDRELRLNAIQLAEKSRSPEVFKKLLSLLNRRGLSQADLETKVAVIRTLAQIRNPEALPALVRIMRSRSFLRPHAHARLKVEIIGSLNNYPTDRVRPLLEKLSESARNELAGLARETLKNVEGE